MQVNDEQRLMLVDSFALLFRGYYATAMYGSPKPNQLGYYTNGLQQFVRYLLDAVRTFQPTHVICALDLGKQTFRNQIYPDYKANRGEPPAELVPQFDMLRKVLDAYEIPYVGVEGYEADDMLGSMAAHYAKRGLSVQILTGDGDVLQLLAPSVEAILMKKGFSNYQRVTVDSLSAYNGLQTPAQVIELKALMGDASDNIPGCPNVGPKTALKLLTQFADVDTLFVQIDEVPAKLREQLLNHRERIEISRDLATIRTDVPFACCLEAGRWQRDTERTAQVLAEIGMKLYK
jgi:5'-3' exonuclease